MSRAEWVTIESFADRFSAEALLGRLTGEGVLAYIDADEPIPGLSRNFSVRVPPELAHRAKWLLGQTVSDDELSALAIGTPGPTDERMS